MRVLRALVPLGAILSLGLAVPLQADRRAVYARDGADVHVFEHAATGARLEYVADSGVCETTPGVHQYSGYATVGPDMHMWFWFFEARNSPATAPLAAWFNGGPGCASTIGLFQENGPCQFYNGSAEPANNTFSFNNYANMLYIDQPIGVGFSYGVDDVNSTAAAAPRVWTMLQAFYAAFPTYQSREFGLFTESYGGHYGPEFATYLRQQNAAIAAGSAAGEPIELVALGVNNGWFEASIQQPAYVSFARNNTYRPLINDSQVANYADALKRFCLPAVSACEQSGADADCTRADMYCNGFVEGPLAASGDWDVYDVRAPAKDPNPPTAYTTYLQNATILARIGANSTYQECGSAAGNAFSATGDNSRPFLPELSALVASNVTTLLWAGDADWICNWFGVLGVADQVAFPGHDSFAAKPLKPYAVDGKPAGTFKTQDNLSFLRVFAAGHEVPFYQPELALQVFIQTMQKRPLTST